MSRSIAGKIKINHYADLFGGDEGGVVQIPIEDLHQFPGHPFSVRDDEDMEKLCESISENGIYTPLIVRVRAAGGYEIISGHRRTHAAKKVGLKEVPVIVKNMDDDEAVISMVDANLQRESILPSEKAFSYRMKMDALKRQGKRTDTFGQIDQKLNTRDDIAEESGESSSQIGRYMRLTELLPEFLAKVDKRELPMNAGVMISYLDKNKQRCLHKILEENDIRLSVADAKKIRNLCKEKDCSKDNMMAILKKDVAPKRQIVLGEKELQKYFPENMSQEAIMVTLVRLLENWSGKEK